jgi:hypothetical protein
MTTTEPSLVRHSLVGPSMAALHCGDARAAMPTCVATGRQDVEIDAHRRGTVRIDNHQACIRKFDDNAYEARLGGVIDSIASDGGDVLSSYAGPGRADVTFKATKEADLHMIQAGDERHQIPEAMVFGG